MMIHGVKTNFIASDDKIESYSTVVNVLARVYNVEGECRTTVWPVKNEPVKCFRIFPDAYVYLRNLELC